MRDNGAIAFFIDAVKTGNRIRELESYRGKVIGTFCNFVPEELVYALDAVPVRLCSGSEQAASRGEELYPRDTCSLVKSCVGSAVAGDGLFARTDLLVIPTPCDAKKKLGGIMGTFKPVHMLELPASKTSKSALDYWLAQIWELIAALQKLTGRQLMRSNLENAINLLNRRQETARRLLDLRKRIPARITGEEAFLIANSSFHCDIEQWILNANRLCEERETVSQSAESKRVPRLLLTGAPLIYPNHKLMRVIESSGAEVVIDETCSGTQRLYHPTVVRDRSVNSMVRAVAEKSLLPTTCPCFTEQIDRMNRVLEMAAEFQVDGIIYHSLRVCPLFDIESVSMQRELKKAGIHSLVISTDYSQEDIGQLRTRINAFIEMIS